MKNTPVKNIMVPISDYATVAENATLMEALAALENAHQRFGDRPYRHQSLVVVNENRHAVGRVSQVDIMRALEPGYKELGDRPWTARMTLSKRMLKTIREELHLWEQPLSVTCQTLESVRVADIMQVPSEGEFVEETDTMNIAMHRIVMCQHHSLLVTRDKKIVGILRSTDVFNVFYDMIEACGYPKKTS
jgi:CBS domain-containing protein